MPYLDDEALERSDVVANCLMNRERTLTGSNGYGKELGFNPLDFLKSKIASAGKASWLDLCCGSGFALNEAAKVVENEGFADRIEIVGVDLVGGGVSASKSLTFIQASLATWEPIRQFDLITCVHGFHYIGDKLGLISRAASWLTDQGRFAANFDLSSIRVQNCLSANRIVGKALRNAGLEYNSRKKLISCDGRRVVRIPFRYLGADDQAGPNYTGQAAVNSYYELECE